MAQRDSISHIASVSSGAYLELRPASGDEWMITAVGDSHNQTYIVARGGSSTFYSIYSNDDTEYPPSPDKYMAKVGWMGYDIQWYLSNTDYMKVINDGSSHIFWFMGVKTKE